MPVKGLWFGFGAYFHDAQTTNTDFFFKKYKMLSSAHQKVIY